MNKLDWLTTREERSLYLFAQCFGNVVAIAYKYHCKIHGYTDPVVFCQEATDRAIAALEAGHADP